MVFVKRAHVYHSGRVYLHTGEDPNSTISCSINSLSSLFLSTPGSEGDYEQAIPFITNKLTLNLLGNLKVSCIASQE